MSANAKSKRQKRARTTAASTFSQIAVEDVENSTYLSGFATKASNPKATNGALKNRRYFESSGIDIASGAQTPHDPELDTVLDKETEGTLDANLAELSLGERLAARHASATTNGVDGQHSWSDDEDRIQEKGGRQIKKRVLTTIPANSLTRTLIQALHSGDSSLLEACLAHSDEVILKNTIMRLPPQLAVPLLTACVERLARGARGNNMKGRGGGASAQRGMALIKWVKTVLIIHGGHLMTMPDLIARLSHLHSTLTIRLTLQERLLSLSGRLDLVLSQVELRSSDAPAPLQSRKKNMKKRAKLKREPSKYIEGESSVEEEQKLGDAGLSEEGDGATEDEEEGSVEDIELGMSEDEEDEEDEEGNGSDDEDNLINGFIDDEAEEDYEEDDSEEDSE